MSDVNPAIVQLWAQQRRGTAGCSVIALAIAVAVDVVAYLFAPSWLFWTLAIITGLFVLLAVTSTIRELGRTRIFYREAKGEWRTGRPTKRSLAQVKAVWAELAERQQALAQFVINALAVEDKRSSFGRASAEAGRGSEEYWATVEIFNHYTSNIDSLRTLVRDLMPTEPPEGVIIEMIEQWLSSIVDQCREFRSRYVTEGQYAPFGAQLSPLIRSQEPPREIDAALT